MTRDADGFFIPTADGIGNGHVVPAAPPIVAMPKIFEGCMSSEHAIAKMIDELTKPASIQLDGFDTMYRRLADGLILVLANQGGLTP